MTHVGEWSLRAGWSWRDEWIWGLVTRFAFIGMVFIVLGPFRVSITFPVAIEADIDEDACAASQVSTPA